MRGRSSIRPETLKRRNKILKYLEAGMTEKDICIQLRIRVTTLEEDYRELRKIHPLGETYFEGLLIQSRELDSLQFKPYPGVLYKIGERRLPSELIHLHRAAAAIFERKPSLLRDQRLNETNVSILSRLTGLSESRIKLLWPALLEIRKDAKKEGLKVEEFIKSKPFSGSLT